MRECLACLGRRPLMCPEEVLRRAGIASAETRERWPRRQGEQFPEITEACSLAWMDMAEEAVLGGGGEAASGLLRALRTSRGLADGGGGTPDGVSPGVQGGGCLWRAGRGPSGGVMTALVGLLEEVSRRGRGVTPRRSPSTLWETRDHACPLDDSWLRCTPGTDQ